MKGGGGENEGPVPGKKPGRHQPARPRETVKVSYTEKT